MRSPAISIIVPCYKVERYLHECLNSIVAQTFTDFEVVCVDDGSPDDGIRILREYEARDSRVRVFSQPNGGVTSARRLGVSKATGEWITFVDADDTLPIDALASLYEATSENTNIVVGFEANPKTQFSDGVDADSYRRYSIAGWYFPTAPWAKLVCRKLFDDHTLDIPREIVYGEDMLMNIRLSFNNDKPVVVIPEVVYNYRQMEDGVARKFVLTAEYRLIYDEHYRTSIPEGKISEYADVVLNEDIKNLLEIIKEEKISYPWWSTDLYKRIIMEVKLYNVKLSLRQIILLNLRPRCFVKYLI